MFTIYEELVLLSLHEAKRTYLDSAIDKVKNGLAGALLAELFLLEKIKSTQNHRLELADYLPVNIPLLG